jgi:hypothetical protein
MFHRSYENTAETFLTLVRDAGLPEPDEWVYDDVNFEVVFLWHAEKLAVIVELDGFRQAA